MADKTKENKNKKIEKKEEIKTVAKKKQTTTKKATEKQSKIIKKEVVQTKKTTTKPKPVEKSIEETKTVKKKKLRLKNKPLLFVVIGVLLILVAVGIIGIMSLNKDDKESILDKIIPSQSTTTTMPISSIDVINENSNTRNVAVMINNINKVWGYQSGIQDAHIVYEIITEGGISRLMAIFKDKDTSRIGSVRSSRIYFLDYVLENDAIYVHVGGSEEALSDIKTLKIADLNASTIFRDKKINLAYEHTAFTSMELINAQISKSKLRNTTEQDNLLNYSADEIDLSTEENAIVANNVYIEYSNIKNTSYVYDAENKVYKRSQNSKAHKDYVTGKQYTAKNIITYQIKNTSYDSYGRQKLANTGSGNGYYITDGYAIPITWEKSNRSSQTIYKKINGEEINVNDGNTFIQIQPLNKELTIN